MGSLFAMSSRKAVEILLREIERNDSKIRKAERAQSGGAIDEKVRAAGDLFKLRQRASWLQQRLHHIERHYRTLGEALWIALEIEALELGDAFERWIEPR